ncbi:MAG: hemC [Patescibacteria group bacterium]|nr:hemC [Patescibacteria group bacterium]
MQNPKHLTIGTRGSKLALIQTELVAHALRTQNPSLQIETKIITTKGDQNMAPIPLDTIGKAWFTAEIEAALQNGEIDLAIHSLKDLPPETPINLTTAAVLQRDDPRDVLVTKHKERLSTLPHGAIIGTDSLRRKTSLLQQRPDLNVKSIRGNVETRLRKLYSEDYHAIVLAAAGLKRLDRLDVVAEFLDSSVFVPAIGQGVLAAEARSDNSELWNMLHSIQDQPTLKATAAEQAFSRIIGGGCKLPISCYVRFEKGTAYIHGMVGSNDTSQCVVKSVSGPEMEAVPLAEKLARTLLKEPFMAGR